MVDPWRYSGNAFSWYEITEVPVQVSLLLLYRTDSSGDPTRGREHASSSLNQPDHATSSLSQPHHSINHITLSTSSPIQLTSSLSQPHHSVNLITQSTSSLNQPHHSTSKHSPISSQVRVPFNHTAYHPPPIPDSNGLADPDSGRQNRSPKKGKKRTIPCLKSSLSPGGFSRSLNVYF